MNTNAESNASKPNVKYVIDNQGNHWICDAEVSESSDLRGQGCWPVQEMVYDRMFGG